MSHEKEIPTVMKACVFDCMTHESWVTGNYPPFYERYRQYLNLLSGAENVELMEHVHLENSEQAENYYQQALDDNYEGIMLRNMNSAYKHGRATHRQDIIFKFKAERTYDGVIVDVVQGKKMKKGLVRERDSVGHLKRSHKLEDYEPDNILGALTVQTTMDDGEIVISNINFGKGYTDKILREMWQDRDSLIGKGVVFKGMVSGVKDKPRMGLLMDFRPELDIKWQKVVFLETIKEVVCEDGYKYTVIAKAILDCIEQNKETTWQIIYLLI